jgi:two-component system invasion response regulator UvrY
MRPIRMVFVSSNALTRKGINQLMPQSEPSIEVVGTFSSFEDVHHYLNNNAADVILIDDSLPRQTNLLHEVSALRLEHVAIAVIVILQRPTVSIALQLLGLGVRGILQKNDDLELYIPQAVVLGRQRGLYLSPGVSSLIDSQRNLPKGYTQRDIDVLQLLAEGKEIVEIAAHVGLAEYTVYRIIRSLRAHFNVQNNAHLITVAHQEKLLEVKTSAE